MVQEAKSAAEGGKPDSSQDVESNLALFVAPTAVDPKSVTVTRQVVLEEVCETPVLVSIKAVGLITVI